MKINMKNFAILRSIFEKTRYYLLDVINKAENSIKTFQFDKKLIRKYKPELDKLFNLKEGEKVKEKFDGNKYIHSRFRSKKDVNENNKNDQKFKLKEYDDGEPKLNLVELRIKDSEINKKIDRITRALEGNKPRTKDKKKKRFRFDLTGQIMENTGPTTQSLINSPLMNKMLKYLRKDIREKIISLRIINRFKESQENQEFFS